MSTSAVTRSGFIRDKRNRLKRYTIDAYFININVLNKLIITSVFYMALTAMEILSAHAETSGHRIALVIGNQFYKHVTPLVNADADAHRIAGELRSRGFSVIEGYDLDRSGMNRNFNRFEAQLSSGSTAVLYYAGHGVQLSGTNVLIPVDLNAASERDIMDDGVQLPMLMARMAAANSARDGGFNLLIVDACRDNPFAAPGRSIGISRGLTPAGSSGVIVLYSAGSGQSALDRLGSDDSNPNGVFTRVLLREMQVPGLSVREMIGRVRTEVAHEAWSIGHEQTPAIYDEAIGDFVMTPTTLEAALPKPVQPSVDREALFWQTAVSSGTRTDLEAYLSAYPSGLFAGLARNRLNALSVAPQQSRPPVAAETIDKWSAGERRRARLALRLTGFTTTPVSEQLLDPEERDAAVRYFQAAMGRPLPGIADLSLADLPAVGDRLSALLARGEASPEGVRATAVLNGPERFARGWAADSGSTNTPRHDSHEASYWYALAARVGYIPAFTQLGFLLTHGQSGETDMVGGALLWWVGSLRGDATSTYNLGAMYEHGVGVASSGDLARFWYRLAAEAGSVPAKDALTRMRP